MTSVQRGKILAETKDRQHPFRAIASRSQHTSTPWTDSQHTRSDGNDHTSSTVWQSAKGGLGLGCQQGHYSGRTRGLTVACLTQTLGRTQGITWSRTHGQHSSQSNRELRQRLHLRWDNNNHVAIFRLVSDVIFLGMRTNQQNGVLHQTDRLDLLKNLGWALFSLW